MPPCSDVRTLARALGEGDDFVTFIDVLPLQRLARDLIHMPRATLEAIAQLHDASHVTLGAKDVLIEVLRSYHHRAQAERRLAQRPLGRGHAHKTIRLQVGQQATVALSCSPTESWQVTLHALGDGLGAAQVAQERHGRRPELVLQVTALQPGHLQLEAQRVAAPLRQRRQLPNAVPVPEHKLPTQPPLFQLSIVVEDAEGEPGALPQEP